LVRMRIIDEAAEIPEAVWRAPTNIIRIYRRLEHEVLTLNDLRVATQGARAHSDDEPSPEAVTRAWKLLGANLNKKQKDWLKKRGYFEFSGPSGNVYRLENDSCWNVRLKGSHRIYHKIKGQHRVRFYDMCFLPDENLPRGDQLLMQKLALETREKDALRIANVAPMDDEKHWNEKMSGFDVDF
jgi:predicted RNA binding protein YcfA (HicA-like mRNA interferase family)